jgi:transposase-like protein
MRRGQRLTDQDKAKRVKTLASLKLNGGNISKTSRETKVPRSTIRKWRNQATETALKLKARKEAEREAEEVAIIADVDEVVRLSADKMEELVADLVQSIHDDIRNPKLRFPLRDKAWTAAVMFDKVQIAKGKPTSINQMIGSLSEEERVAGVEKILATARQRRLNATGKEMSIVDGGKTTTKKQKAQ